MNAVRDAWTDERLDDMQGEMRRGFDRVDADLRELRVETTSRLERLETKFDARFDAMQRTMIVGFASIAAGLLASTAATVLAAVLG